MRREISLGLLRDGYRTLDRMREERGGPDWFGARMLGRRALVVRGAEGTRTFYDDELVTRRGAIPAPVRLLLFGPGAVHNLAGTDHRRRKALYLEIVTRESAERLAAEVAGRLEARVATWPGPDPVRVFDELVQVYGGAVLSWGGTAPDPDEAEAVSRELARLVDGFGVLGTSYPRAWLARVRATRWARDRVLQVRSGDRTAPAGSALAVMAASDLSPTVAGVELLNVLRPTVAVAYFGAWAAQALALHPGWKGRLAANDPADLRAFEHELRRWYPFVPLLTGRLLREHEWQGTTYRKRDFVVLDVPGTNRDPDRWEDPSRFDPQRFVGREPDAFDYVPQGGGDPVHGHRCPGEPLAVGILEATTRQLARLDYELAPGAEAVPTRRIPSLPPHGLEITGVSPASAGVLA